MSQITEVTCVDELDRYQLLWKALQGQTPGATFFHSVHCLKSFWQHFESEQRLRVLFVHVAGEPIGILPLVQRSRVTRFGSAEVLTYPWAERGICYGPLGPNPAATLVAAMRYLSDRRDWDLLDLRWIPVEFDRGRTQLAMDFAGMRGAQMTSKTTSVIDLDGTWHSYIQCRETALQERLQCAPATAESESLSYERYRPGGSMFADDNPRWELFDECLELLDRCPQTSINKTNEQADEDPFQRHIHRLAARAGSLDMNLLRCNGRLMAMAYGYYQDGILHVMQIKVDPRFSSLDPSTLLLASMVRDSFHRGDRRLDLAAVASNINQFWQTSTVTRERCTYYSLASPRGQLMRLQRWLRTARRDRIAECAG